MKKEDIRRIFAIVSKTSNIFKQLNLPVEPTALIGKQVYISGEEKENDWSSFITITTISSILFGGQSKVLEELEKEGSEMIHFHLANGGKLIFDSNKPENITYIGPVCFSEENAEYHNVNVEFYL